MPSLAFPFSVLLFFLNVYHCHHFISLSRHYHHLFTFFPFHCVHNMVTAITFLYLCSLCVYQLGTPKVLFPCFLNSNGFLFIHHWHRQMPKCCFSFSLFSFSLLLSCVILKPPNSKQASPFLFFAPHFPKTA